MRNKVEALPADRGASTLGGCAPTSRSSAAGSGKSLLHREPGSILRSSSALSPESLILNALPEKPACTNTPPRADAVSSVMKRAFRGTLIGQFRPIHRIHPPSAFWLKRKGAISLFSYAVLIFKFVSPSYCRPNYCEQLSLTIFKIVTCRSA